MYVLVAMLFLLYNIVISNSWIIADMPIVLQLFFEFQFYTWKIPHLHAHSSVVPSHCNA